jgi:jasmonate ZIM domain-containing protein
LFLGAEGEKAERRKETMELFPQSTEVGVKDATRLCHLFALLLPA